MLLESLRVFISFSGDAEGRADPGTAQAAVPFRGLTSTESMVKKGGGVSQAARRDGTRVWGVPCPQPWPTYRSSIQVGTL